MGQHPPQRHRERGDGASVRGRISENAKLTYQAQVAELYFQMHGLDGDADLLQRTVTAYGQSLQLTQDRLAAGVASGADVAQAQAQLETARGQLIDIGVQRAQFEHAIAILLGKARR